MRDITILASVQHLYNISDMLQFAFFKSILLFIVWAAYIFRILDKSLEILKLK